MEKIDGVSFVSKDYLFDLMYVLMNSSNADKIQRILRRINETAFIDIAFDLPAVKKYKRFFEKIVEYRLKGYSSSAIVEQLNSGTWEPIYNELMQHIKTKPIDEESILKTFEKKLKTVHILDFLFKYARLNTEIKDNDEILNQLIREINTLYRNIADDAEYIERDYTDIDNIDKRLLERIKKITGKGHTRVISTGINLLDAIFRTKRGMETGELYIIGAPYGMGKTRFVVRLGTNMFLNGATVYHITIENKMEDVEELYDTALTGKSPEVIYSEIVKEVMGKDLSDNEILKLIDEKLKDYKQELKKRLGQVNNDKKEDKDNNDKENERPNAIFIKKYHPYRVSVNDIRAWISAKIQETGKKPDVIIVDHMDILVPSIKSRGEMSLFQKGEIIAGELKTLAEQYNAIVLTPTQMNREGVKGNTGKKGDEIGGESTSRSMAKNELTGFLMTLNQNREEALHGYMRLFIDKNRIGIDKVVIPIKFDKATLEIEPITDDNILMNFSELVRQNVKYLEKRYKGEKEDDLDIVSTQEMDIENQIDELIQEDNIIQEENKEYYFSELKEFIDSIKNKPIDNYEIESDDKNIKVKLGNVVYLVDKESVTRTRDKALSSEENLQKIKQYPLLYDIILQVD